MDTIAPPHGGRPRRKPAAGAALLAAAAAFLGMATAARAEPAIGLAGNALFSFDTAAPGTVGALQGITGLQAGETLLSLDYRPATGALYGLGSAGNLYTVNAGTGAATFASMLSTALVGSGFDIAFNATVDRLRVVGTSGQDLRVNVDTGLTTVDAALAYAAGDPNAGRAPNVTAVGYTNQFAGAATTTLYDIDLTNTNGVLTIQNPPNAGTLNTVGTLGVGGLLSLDISGGTGVAYAASGSALYTVNLTTGAATLVGGFGFQNVTDFTLVPVPEPGSLAVLGMGLLGLFAARRRQAG